jgi:hypothetical protein
MPSAPVAVSGEIDGPETIVVVDRAGAIRPELHGGRYVPGDREATSLPGGHAPRGRVYGHCEHRPQGDMEELSWRQGEGGLPFGVGGDPLEFGSPGRRRRRQWGRYRADDRQRYH